MIDHVVSYSQNFEDIILSAFFTDIDKGYYVDIGAFDPIEDSVTKYFYERGWSGINVEPNRRLYEKLLRDRPRDTNLNCGVSNKKGELKYREYINGKGLSTFSSDMKTDYKKNPTFNTKEFTDTTTPVKRLVDILDEVKPKAIHFMKVDVEGYEYEVLSSNDWKRYRPEVLCIEANHILHDWRPLLKDARYKLFFNDGLNNYYVADEASQRMKNFQYVEMVLGRPVLKLSWSKQLKTLEGEAARNKAYADRLADMNADLEATNGALHHQITQLRSVRSLIRIFPKAVHNMIKTRLQNSQAYNTYPSIRVQGDDAETMLAAIQDADRRSLTQKPSYSNRLKLYIKKIILTIYLTIAHLALRAGKVILKITRRVRIGGRTA